MKWSHVYIITTMDAVGSWYGRRVCAIDGAQCGRLSRSSIAVMSHSDRWWSPMVALSACPGRRDVGEWASYWRRGRRGNALWMVQSVCLSVRLSVCLPLCLSVSLSLCLSLCLSVTPFWLCSHHRIINFSGVITNDRSDVHAKCQGQGSKVKVTEVNTPLFRTVTPVRIHIWWRNDAQSLMLLRKVALLFSRSSILTFDPNWGFPDCSSSFNSPMATKWCTKLEVA